MPPERLGAYLREFVALLDGTASTAWPTVTSATAACTSGWTSRWPTRRSVPGVPARRRAALVAAHGGSMSGEHGDGRARGELLPRCTPPRRSRCSPRSSALFDPAGLLNPGVLVDPRRSTPTCGGPLARPCGPARVRLPHDGGDVTTAVHRCVGVGQVPGRPDRRRRRDVPVLPGHPGREGLHPGSGPGAAGDGQRHAAAARAGSPRRCWSRWTCACRARAAPATARPGSTWPPTRPRCCTSGTADASGRRGTTCWGSCRGGPGSRAGHRGSPTPPPPSRCCGSRCCVSAGSTRAVPCRASPPSRSGAGAPGTGRPATARAARCCCGSTRSPTRSTPAVPRRRCGCSSRRVGR